MKELTIEVAPRSEKGGRVNGRLRNDGKLPAVVYGFGIGDGSGVGSRAIEISNREFQKLASRSRTSQVFVFKSDDASLDGKRAIVQDIQKSFQRGNVLHVDFQALEEGRPLKVRVPLKVTGEAEGVKNQGGVLTTSAHTVTLKCFPDRIPDMLQVDISKMNVGERIRTGELDLPDGVVLRSNPLETIASIISGRKAKQMAQEAGAGAAEGSGTEAGA